MYGDMRNGSSTRWSQVNHVANALDRAKNVQICDISYVLSENSVTGKMLMEYFFLQSDIRRVCPD
jgi:hypothetical protein